MSSRIANMIAKNVEGDMRKSCYAFGKTYANCGNNNHFAVGCHTNQNFKTQYNIVNVIVEEGNNNIVSDNEFK